MSEADQPVLIYTTFPSLEEAKRVGAALVEARLAACVNMFPGMISIFEWESALDEAEGVAMIIKTRAGLVGEVETLTKSMHAYEVPAMLVLPTQGGSADYSAWIVRQTQSRGQT